MLSIFSLPKPFKGHIGIIQRNAVASWVRLGSSCEIVLFGNEEGVADVAKEFAVRHVPEVAKNEYGTPMVNDVFERAERIATGDLLCYVNSDIILGSDFVQSVEKVRAWTERFLMIGECWDMRIDNRLPFETVSWENDLCDLVRQSGKSRGPWYIDYFVFSRGLYENIPGFAIGRAGFDNWLVWQAKSSGAAVIDATREVKAVHQNHDYSHVPGGKEWSYKGDEARRNVELAGGPSQLFLISDATYRLSNTRILRNFGACFRLNFRWTRAKFRATAYVISLGWKLVEWTRPVRHRIGLRKGCITRLKMHISWERRD
jgi:hypothetical protein